MIVKLLVEGGNMLPGPALSQKLGPIGVNINQVISQVNEATKLFKGIKVPVELNIDASTKKVKIKVSSPPVSELIKKELGVEKGSGDHKKEKVGNISIEQLISIAKTKLPDMLEKDLKAALKTVVGSCVSLGVLVESKNPIEIEQEIDKGKYDKEIKEERMIVSPEKSAKLKEFFAVLHKKEAAALAEEEAAAKASEESKASAEGTAKSSLEKKEATPLKEKK